MNRTVLSVAAGFAAIALLLAGGLFVGWSRLGADQALMPGRWEASPSWILSSLGVSLVAAIAGGFVCAVLGRSMRAPSILSALVFGVGIVSAAAILLAPHSSSARGQDVTLLEAIRQTREPAWLVGATPLVAATGVLLGALRRLRGEAPDVPPIAPTSP
jgi:hypothetical protein